MSFFFYLVEDVLDLLIKNKSLTSTLISSITLSGLKEDHFLYIIATFANLSSKSIDSSLLLFCRRIE